MSSDARQDLAEHEDVVRRISDQRPVRGRSSIEILRRKQILGSARAAESLLERGADFLMSFSDVKLLHMADTNDVFGFHVAVDQSVNLVEVLESQRDMQRGILGLGEGQTWRKGFESVVERQRSALEKQRHSRLVLVARTEAMERENVRMIEASIRTAAFESNFFIVINSDARFLVG